MNVRIAGSATLAAILLASMGPAVAASMSPHDSVFQGEAAPLLPASNELFRIRLMQDSPGYAWTKLLAGTHRVADSLELTVNYPADEMGTAAAAALQRAILSHEEISTRSKNFIVPDGREPDGSGRIGEKDTTRLWCTNITVGTTQTTGDVEYTWEWRNTVDSTGDGKPDSDPQWVLVGIRVSLFMGQDEQICF